MPRRPWAQEEDDQGIDDVIIAIYGAEPFIVGLASDLLAGGGTLPDINTDLSGLRARLDAIDPSPGNTDAWRGADRLLHALEDLVTEIRPHLS